MFVPISCRIFLTKLYSLPSPFLTLLQELVAVDLDCVHGRGDWSQRDCDVWFCRCFTFKFESGFQLVCVVLKGDFKWMYRVYACFMFKGFVRSVLYYFRKFLLSLDSGCDKNSPN